MVKKSQKSVMTLQKLVIILGLISSLVTATIGIGNEVVGATKNWIVADNTSEVSTMRNEIEILKQDIIKIKDEIHNNSLMAFSKKSLDIQEVRMTSNVNHQKHNDSFGWILGIIGIIGLIAFGIWHHFHNKKHT